MDILFSNNLDPSAKLDSVVNSVVMTQGFQRTDGIDDGEPVNYALLWDGLEGSMRTLPAVDRRHSGWESRGDSNAARWVVQNQSRANQRSLNRS